MMKAVKLAKKIQKRLPKWSGIESAELKKLGVEKMKTLIKLTAYESKEKEQEEELTIDIAAIQMSYCLMEGQQPSPESITKLQKEWMAEAQETNENLDNGNT